MKDCLQLFSDGTAGWFREKLGEPTRVQEASWPAIAAGGHVLVSAPTGTGKTLSAFLVFLDRLKTRAMEGKLPRELQLVYVSPLKSLAADIRENLRKPLEGIGGQELLSVAVRTGDTTPRERQQMVRKPPHILIITPESLYLMLTSKTGQNVLCTAGAVIIDELHALIDTKRGAHLMLSLARLDALCGRHLQRIGLSATIAPLDRAARYLAPEAVTVDVSAALSVGGGYTLDQLRPLLVEAVEAYLLSIRQDWDTPETSGRTNYASWVYAARVTAAMLSVRGVINVTDLTLNRKAEDLALSETGELQQVPVLGEVELRA